MFFTFLHTQFIPANQTYQKVQDKNYFKSLKKTPNFPTPINPQPDFVASLDLLLEL